MVVSDSVPSVAVVEVAVGSEEQFAAALASVIEVLATAADVAAWVVN